MSKYFLEEKEDEIFFSQYEDTRDEKYIKYLQEIFPSEKLSKEKIKCLCDYLRFIGRYSIRYEKETLESLFVIMQRFKCLSSKAFDELFRFYIKDLFDTYKLEDTLEKLILSFGYSDQMYEEFLKYVERKADELDLMYKQDAERLEIYTQEYGVRFIDSLKSFILRTHVPADKVLEKMPSADIIKQDEQQLLDLSYFYRIYMGLCEPVSYTYFKTYVKDGCLDRLPETPKYYINQSIEKEATFTKTEFLKSLKQTQVLKK